MHLGQNVSEADSFPREKVIFSDPVTYKRRRIMGNLLSTFVHMSKTIFYKCPVTRNSFDFLDHFLFREDPFIFLSDPDVKIVTIEESDY